MFTKLKQTTGTVLAGRRRWIVAGGVAVLVLGGAATATAAVADRHDDRSGSHGRHHDGGDDGIGDDGAVPPATAVTLAQAAETAVAEAGGGIVYEIDMDGTRDRPFWDVELYGTDGRWHEVRVDATSGAVTGHEVDGTGTGADETDGDDGDSAG